MEQTVSTQETNNNIKTPRFMKSYFKQGILGNMKILVVLFVLNMLSFPLTTLSCIIASAKNKGTENYSNMPDMLFVLACLFTGVCVLAGVVIVLQNFSYLYKKQNVDMYLSLPLKNSQRFCCDYFSGLACYLVPFLLSGVVTVLLSCVVKMIGDVNYVVEELNMQRIIAELYVFAALVMAMFYTFTVLVASICGSLFETLFYTVVINGLIPGLIAIVAVLIFGNSFGINILRVMLPVFGKTSPAGAAIGLILETDLYTEEEFITWGFFFRHIIWLAVMTAVFAFAAYLLYRKRKAEDVSKPFVFRIFYYVIITAIILCISAFVVIDDELIIPLVITMAVVYLIFEVVNKRGFKRFGFSVIRCLVTITACIIFVTLCYNTSGFGISYKVPEAKDVKSVSVNYVGFGSGLDDQLTLSDPETIDWVIKAHKSIIEKYDDSERDYFDSYGPSNSVEYVFITYTMKSGRKISREYNITIDEVKMLYHIAEDSGFEKEFKRVMSDADNYITYVEDIFGLTKKYFIDKNVYGEQRDKVCEEIISAIAKDTANRSFQQLTAPTEQPLVVIRIMDSDVFVYSYDKNVISVLNKWGIDVDSIVSAKDNMLKTPFSTPMDTIISYDPSVDEETVEHYYSDSICPTENVSDGWGYYLEYDYSSYDVRISESDEKMYELANELLQVALPEYISDKPLYKCTVNYETFFIPEEYSDKAKQLHEYCKNQYWTYAPPDRDEDYTYEDEYDNYTVYDDYPEYDYDY